MKVRLHSSIFKTELGFLPLGKSSSTSSRISQPVLHRWTAGGNNKFAFPSKRDSVLLQTCFQSWIATGLFYSMCLINLAFLLNVQMPLKGYPRSTRGTTESLFFKKNLKKILKTRSFPYFVYKWKSKIYGGTFPFHNPRKIYIFVLPSIKILNLNKNWPEYLLSWKSCN